MTELTTLRDFFRFALSEFGRKPIELGHGTDSLWDEALALVFGGVNLSPDADDRLLDATLTMNERYHLLELIRKRTDQRIPTPYLTGLSWYAGLPFYIDNRVLIPRSPIFELVEIEFSPYLTISADKPLRFLDLCTGSGCLGIITALRFPESTGVLTDIDCGACEVAYRNVVFHGLEPTVVVTESDGFEALTYERFDLIICNPPYVDREDMTRLPPEYCHEPEVALKSGQDGMGLVRRLLAQAADWLTDGGVMVLEVGNTWPFLEREVTGRTQQPISWIPLKDGGHGVCVLSKKELNALYSAFS